MKRFIIGALAAAALAVPAGASADTTQTAGAATQAESAIPPCPTSNLSYCIRYWLESAVDLDPVAACTTPVMYCVEQALTRAFIIAENAVHTAEETAAAVVDLIDDPPNLDAVCYAVWGRPCSSLV